jgi:hypothetical protein
MLLTPFHKKSIRKHEKVYQCLLEDLVEKDILPASVVDELLAGCAGHKPAAKVYADED